MTYCENCGEETANNRLCNRCKRLPMTEFVYCKRCGGRSLEFHSETSRENFWGGDAYRVDVVGYSCNECGFEYED